MRLALKYFFLLFFTLSIVPGCFTQYKTELEQQKLKSIPDIISYSKNYDGHLQGLASDFDTFIFWSHTKQLVKTDLTGNILKVIDVPFHHGDLEFYKGQIFVAVNFGKFNEEPGLADSWVHVYNADDLSFSKKYPVPEVVHGAGGIAIHDEKVMIVGGLPEDGNYDVNFIYEYNLSFNLQKIHELASGFTYKGIQTACYFKDYWYFACYGNLEKGYFPKVLKVKENNNDDLELIQSFDVDMSYGMIGLKGDEFLFSNRNLDSTLRKSSLFSFK
ncbi:MAG: hypothetical protein HOG79_06105 [Prolixibacteraceae bacterium]|nr:hypothetical protein [Prolixibacteraceae bacterium]